MSAAGLVLDLADKLTLAVGALMAAAVLSGATQIAWDAVHQHAKRKRGRTCPICQLPERVHLPDGTCPGSIFEPVPTKGLPPRP